MKKLGSFKYHTRKIVLYSSDTEATYHVVVKIINSLRSRSEILSHDTFVTLSQARQLFEATVTDLIHNTSLSDVSLYMQKS